MSGAPPPPADQVVRRGRGTFRQTLHSAAPAPQPSAPGAALAAAATDRFAFAFERDTKPIDVTGAELAEAETARVQLFRRERRKRQIVLIGDIAAMAQYGICKLFGHMGPKPQRLQRKLIRLVHLALPVTPPPYAINAQQPTAPDGPSVGSESGVVASEPPEEVPIFADGPPSKKTDAAARETIASTTHEPQEPEAPDVMQPLSTDVAGATDHQSTSTLASPVLTLKKFKSLTPYFRKELLELWNLEDIAKQRVQLLINLGSGFVCGSNHNRNLQEATFHELIEKWNDESLQLYFINDCPPCVSRAADMCCNTKETVGRRNYSVVKLTFFSQERQSRSIARALWNGDMNAFELIDVESLGITFSWTLFSVDPTRSITDPNGSRSLKKSVAFPAELSFRAFHRSKNVSEHGASGTARAVLAQLTEAEHNFFRHGSTSQYDTLDLSGVCAADALSTDFKLESIQIEHVDQKKLRSGLLVEGSNTMLIEGFGETTQQQRPSAGGVPIRGAADEDPLAAETQGPKLTFFKTRSNYIHWKLDSDKSNNENLENLDAALDLCEAILSKANNISSEDSRGGAAPEAL